MMSQTRQHANNRRFSSGQNTSQKLLPFVGDCPKVTEYLAEKRYLSYWGPVKFIDVLLRGYGQVNVYSFCFLSCTLGIYCAILLTAGVTYRGTSEKLHSGLQEVVYANNPISGAIVLIALTIADAHFSIAGLTTSSAGLLASLSLISQNAHDVQQGLTVYNPLLIGLITTSALPERYGIQLQLWHWFLMIFAAVLSVYVTSAFSNIMGSLTRFPLPCFTLPFNVVQPVLFLCIVSLTYSPGNISSPLVQKQFTSPTPLLQNNISSHHTSPEDLMEISQDLLSRGLQNLTDIRRPLKMSGVSISNEVTVAYSNLYISQEIPKKLQDPQSLTTPTITLLEGAFHTDSIQKTSNIEEATAELPSAHSIVAKDIESSAATTTISNSSLATWPKTGGTETVNRTNRNAESDELQSLKAENEYKEAAYMSNVNSVNSTKNYGKESTHNSAEDAMQSTDWGEVFSGVVLSMSRVYGSNYPQGAILIYAAVLLCSPILAAFALIGATTGTLTGLLLTDPATYATTNGVYEGGWGSNGLLCAMAIGGYYFVLTWQAAITAVFSAIFATALQFVLIPAFASGNLYPMSLPFNLSALLLLCVVSPGAIVRPVHLSIPEKHRSEYQRYLHMQAHNTEEITPEMMEYGKATRE